MKASSVLLVIILMSASNSWAEIYKYIDENGQVTFGTEWKPGAKRLDLPSTPAPLPKMSKREATSAEMIKCFDKHRNSFLDPRSAYPVSATYTVLEYNKPPDGKAKPKSETYVEVDVSARNKLGGASRTKVRCKVN